MKASTKVFYLPLVAALGLAFSGTAIANDQGRDSDRGGKGFERMATELNLSPEQQKAFKSIHLKAKSEMQKNRDAMKANRDALRQLDTSDKHYSRNVAKLADEQGKLVADSIKQRAKTRAETDALLTPEQRDKARQLKEERRDRKDSKWGSSKRDGSKRGDSNREGPRHENGPRF